MGKTPCAVITPNVTLSKGGSNNDVFQATKAAMNTQAHTGDPP